MACTESVLPGTWTKTPSYMLYWRNEVMSTHTLKKKCPRCKRWRKFTVPSDHYFGAYHEWGKDEAGRWICYWCIARETPNGEAKLIEDRRKYYAFRKERK